MDPLQTLHQKLNVANAATVQLYVDLSGSSEGSTATRADPLAGVQSGFDGCKIKPAGNNLLNLSLINIRLIGLRLINVGLDTANKLPRQHGIARVVAQLDERL